MKNNRLLSEELHQLIDSYHSGSSDLAHLSQRAETLVEAMRPRLPADIFLSAMNCVYLIEEISALAMDEDRKITAVESQDIDQHLSILEDLVVVG